MGTMGFGLPAAIGAQFAQPQRLVIDIDGDSEHPHEHRRARDRHHLRPAGEGRGAQQLRRRHGEAVAEAVLQGAAVGERQARCTRRTSSRPRRPTASATPCASSTRRMCRASSRSSWRFAGPAFLEVMIDPDAGVYPMVGPGPELRGDDHRRLHPLAPQGRHQDARALGDVLTWRRGPIITRRTPPARTGSTSAWRCRRSS